MEGRFEIERSHPIADMLVERDLAEPGSDAIEIVVSRTIAADGSGKARVNGRMATVALLGEIGRSLVEIVGQHEHQRLGAASFQRSALDTFAGAAESAADVAAKVRAALDAMRKLDELTADEQARARQIDVLRYEVAEIEGAALAEGEWERLRADAQRLEHAETIARATSDALEHLRGEGAAEERLTQAGRELAEAASHDPSLSEAAERLERAAIEVADLGTELAGRTVAPDPDALEAARARIADLSKLHRKYGDDYHAVSAYLAQARARLEELEDVNSALEKHARVAEELINEARIGATELSAVRAEAAPRLARALVDALKDLALPDAAVRIKLEAKDLYEGGLDNVSFEVALNPAETERPLTKVASGGELSRFALALHVLTTDGAVPTMVFDEVDAGVGGKTAQSVGRMLARLSQTGTQVFLVTHLPQVAAFADDHLRVSKQRQADGARVRVTSVSGEERIGELSRMLAGLESDRAKEHARELLAMANPRGAHRRRTARAPGVGAA